MKKYILLDRRISTYAETETIINKFADEGYRVTHVEGTMIIMAHCTVQR